MQQLDGPAAAEADVPPPSLRSIDELEVLVRICSFLDRPRDLGRLACASRTFGSPIEWVAANETKPEPRSVVEESARRWVLARQPEGSCPAADGWYDRAAQSWARRMDALQFASQQLLS